MKRKYSIYFILMISILMGSMFLMKYFNITRIDVNEKEAKITINFLVPIIQEELASHLSFTTSNNISINCSYQIIWRSPQIAEIYVKEETPIKGLQINLYIKDCPSKWHGMTKSEKITIPFSVPIQVKEANTTKLVSSTEAFMISFNTPITITELSKHLHSDAKFDICYYKEPSTHPAIHEKTCFLLTPTQQLENGKTYTLTIKSGLKADSGSLLSRDTHLYLQVDQKPIFIQTYPEAGDKWIGLYPKLTFTTQTPVKMAIAKINQETIRAIMLDEYHGYFLLSNLLAPDTNYILQMQLKADSGELSEIKTIPFSTTSINNHRSWLEISCGAQKCIRYYEGEQCIRTFICGIGKELSSNDYGTYYIQNKNEVYENPQKHEGANYWILLNDHFGIHGMVRNSYWEINESRLGDIGGLTEGKNIILSDEDASWLYQKITSQTMVIIKG